MPLRHRRRLQRRVLPFTISPANRIRPTIRSPGPWQESGCRPYRPAAKCPPLPARRTGARAMQDKSCPYSAPHIAARRVQIQLALADGKAKSRRSELVSPIPQPDGHDGPGLVGEFVPGVAAVIEDVGVGLEHAVREPVLAHELPDVLDRIEFRALWQQREW